VDNREVLKMHNNLDQVSAPAVNQYLQLAQHYDLAVEDILHDLAISPALLSDNSLYISGDKLQQLIAKLIELSGDELFGLHTAKYVQPVSYSVLGFITMNCETLGDAITKIKPFEKLVGDMGTTDIEQHGKNIVISWFCHYSDPLVRRHMVDNCLASWLIFAHYLTSVDHAPVKVMLKRKQPNLQQCAEYQKLFMCSVIFNQERDAIIFDQALMALPLKKGDKQLLSSLEAHANQLINSRQVESNIVIQTKQLILQCLSHKGTNQQAIADLLGISAKTLQRRLKGENTQFNQLADEVRLQATQDLLQDNTLKLDEISEQIGFSDVRSFFRWFQKLANMTPGQYRKRHH